MSSKIKGSICGIVAAISYGTNPLGALGLKALGITTGSMLFYRFAIAIIILGGILIFQRESFSITKKELCVLAALGILFSLSSLGLFISFNYMEAGIASTILFIYPVIVAVMMAVLFKEQTSLSTMIAIFLSLGGIVLLYQGDGNVVLDAVGMAFVLFASFTYAVYIIVTNKMPVNHSPVKITFYVLVFALMVVIIYSLISPDNYIQWLETPEMWGYVSILAVISTVISVVLITIAIKEIGSTPTAIMGALEPLTAVLIGVLVFHEKFTLRLVGGIILIMAAVLLIIIKDAFKNKVANR